MADRCTMAFHCEGHQWYFLDGCLPSDPKRTQDILLAQSFIDEDELSRWIGQLSESAKDRLLERSPEVVPVCFSPVWLDDPTASVSLEEYRKSVAWAALDAAATAAILAPKTPKRSKSR